MTDSDNCPHINTIVFKGPELVDFCLDCGFFLREDNVWGPLDLPEDDLDYPDMWEVPK
jgi:hypothetical protein